VTEISEVMIEIVELAARLGVTEIYELPGCWEHAVDDGWWLALNGHREPVACSRGPEVPPLSAYVEWYGWPAGIVGFHGGVVAAGSEANEDALLEALRAAGGTSE
jgi:hypothetical protein